MYNYFPPNSSLQLVTYCGNVIILEWSGTAVANLLDPTGHQWSADHQLATTGLEGLNILAQTLPVSLYVCAWGSRLGERWGETIKLFSIIIQRDEILSDITDLLLLRCINWAFSLWDEMLFSSLRMSFSTKQQPSMVPSVQVFPDCLWILKHFHEHYLISSSQAHLFRFRGALTLIQSVTGTWSSQLWTMICECLWWVITWCPFKWYSLNVCSVLT